MALRIGLSLHPQPCFSSGDAVITFRDLLLFPGVVVIPVQLGQQAQAYTRRPQNEGAPHLSWIFNSGTRDVGDGMPTWRLKNLESSKMLKDGKGGTEEDRA